MTFLTELKNKDEHVHQESGRPLSAKGILDYVSQEDLFKLMRLVTDAVFKSEQVMAEILLFDENSME